ncbi:hypothetical protein EDEG_02553 [Edhazardia aedis USNM 41457]|uniref:Phosphoribulokinase/uridine kinase domain-containing protein n=1 Tax=Edhazardia aedis (strain USNM 41457) TaxID=1003232 RepID=J9D6E3_EDHAE|nr:hypothetical protein EDEG_02553 [Edhazardia aedis USNM 41457]|eukprot:EJW03074.1 hypothetical protein EDEG_02553 [Edhazardia aedis USNM 41457]
MTETKGISTSSRKKNKIIELTTMEQKMLNDKIKNSDKSLQEIVDHCFGMQFENNKKYVICLQGASSSGKSTLAHNLYHLFQENKINCFLLELDKYYKSLDPQKDNTNYDFDNPASLDWKAINKVVKDLHDDQNTLSVQEYSFITAISSGPVTILNPKPTVIIIEGIYSFNIFNKKVFNLPNFDCRNSIKKIENEFVDNSNKFPNFRILRLKLCICQSKGLKVRISRDVLLRGRVAENSIVQFNKFVWPATKKWVYNKIFETDVAIAHGNFNEKKMKLFVGAVTKFFIGKTVCFSGMGLQGDFKKESRIKCSGECVKNCNSSVLLTDDDD